MRVIADLISYLTAQGLLSHQDLERLRRRGFIEGPPVEPAFSPDPDDRTDAKELDDAEAVAERFDHHPPARRRGRAPPRPALTAKEISEHILRAWPVWERQLAPLVPLGAGLDPAVTDLERAFRKIENAAPESIEGALVRTLSRHPKQLGPIWSALAFSTDDEGAIAADARGTAVQAYRAILAGRTYDELGRYRFALREPGLPRVLVLVRTQRKVLRGLGQLLLRRPRLFDSGVSAAYPSSALCYWSLILAVAAWASTDQPPRPPWQLADQLMQAPAAAVAKRAWACAVAMDVPGIRVLLESVADTHIPVTVQCPFEWSRTWFPK